MFKVNDDVISAINITKVYNMADEKVIALKDITLKIKRGEFVAIMGPSGSGKTTFLNCMSTLDDITSGKLYIDGKDVDTMNDASRSAFRSIKMGFIFQNYNLIPVLTALENVELPMMIANKSVKYSKSRALALLNKMMIATAAGRRPSELSGGMQQKVAICRAISNNPAILWADEPTGNIDSDMSKEIMEMLVNLNKNEHLTIILVTHDANIAKYAKRLIKMRDGIIESDSSASN